MKVLIIDDDRKELNQTYSLLNRYRKLRNMNVLIEMKTAFIPIEKVAHHYDAIFVDTEIESQNGIHYASNIRKLDRDIQIIFTSSHDKYLLDGYQASANLFCLKPIEEDYLYTKLDILFEMHLYYHKGITLPWISNKRIYFKDILYIEVLRRKTIIHLPLKNSFECYYTLKKWKEIIGDAPFEQPHRAFYINLEHIEKVNKNDILMKDKSTIPLTSIYKDTFISKYSIFSKKSL